METTKLKSLAGCVLAVSVAVAVGWWVTGAGSPAVSRADAPPAAGGEQPSLERLAEEAEAIRLVDKMELSKEQLTRLAGWLENLRSLEQQFRQQREKALEPVAKAVRAVRDARASGRDPDPADVAAVSTALQLMPQLISRLRRDTAFAITAELKPEQLAVFRVYAGIDWPEGSVNPDRPLPRIGLHYSLSAVGWNGERPLRLPAGAAAPWGVPANTATGKDDVRVLPLKRRGDYDDRTREKDRYRNGMLQRPRRGKDGRDTSVSDAEAVETVLLRPELLHPLAQYCKRSAEGR